MLYFGLATVWKSLFEGNFEVDLLFVEFLVFLLDLVTTNLHCITNRITLKPLKTLKPEGFFGF